MSETEIEWNLLHRPLSIRLDFGDASIASPPRRRDTRQEPASPTQESISMTTPESIRSTDTSSCGDSGLATPDPPRPSFSPLSSPSTSPRRIETSLHTPQLFEFPTTPSGRRPGRQRSRLVGERLSRTAPGRGAPRRQRKESVGANVNPFTPAAQSSLPKREKREWDEELFLNYDISPSPSKGLRLKDSNIGRYNAEFKEMCLIGSGEYGAVYKCRNRLDGCIYALKRSKQPVAGSVDEQFASREVYAHAVLESHPHIVRYYSAWTEDNHMFIQSEFCNGGSLSSAITRKVLRGQMYSESDLTEMLLQVAQGLEYIHSKRLVHLDIKPGNIFISCSDVEGTIDCDCCCNKQFNPLIYKIGDMGHVTSIDNPDAEDGDCRFMARELLEENYHHLQKADVFALALTAYVMGSGEELPKNGPKWHEIRDGNLPELTHCSVPFNQLLKSMVHKEPSARPSASALTQHPVLCPFATKSKDELHKELYEEKLKNEALAQELKVARDAAMWNVCSRLVGGNSKWKANRSFSVSGW